MFVSSTAALRRVRLRLPRLHYPYFYGYTMAMKICYRVLFHYEDKCVTDGSSRGRNARISKVEFPARVWL
jgi:hypothetical protein